MSVELSFNLLIQETCKSISIAYAVISELTGIVSKPVSAAATTSSMRTKPTDLIIQTSSVQNISHIATTVIRLVTPTPPPTTRITISTSTACGVAVGNTLLGSTDGFGLRKLKSTNMVGGLLISTKPSQTLWAVVVSPKPTYKAT